MKQICLTDEEIANIRQALWTAHFYSVGHRHAYAMFNEKVEQGEELPEKKISGDPNTEMKLEHPHD